MVICSAAFPSPSDPREVDIAISPDSVCIAKGDSDSSIAFWNINNNQLISKCGGHKSRVGPIAFSPDGSLLASSSRDGAVILWKVERNKLNKYFEFNSYLDAGKYDRVVERGHRLASVAFYKNEKLIVSTNSSVQIWDVDKKRRETLREREGPFARIALAVSSEGLIAYNDDHNKNNIDSHVIRVIDHDRNYEIFPRAGSQVLALGFSHKGSLLACGLQDGSVEVWNVKANTLEYINKSISATVRRAPMVRCVAFSTDDRLLAWGSIRGLNVWEYRKGINRSPAIDDDEYEVASSVAFSADGEMVVISASTIDESSERLKIFSVEFLPKHPLEF
jgi:WD40 repeat protein